MRFNRRCVAFLLLALSLLISACTSSESRTDHNTLVYGLTLEPSGFDPHINQSAEIGIVLRQVYDTLIYRDPETAEFVPGLATSWTVSEDGLTYTFTLRQNVTFHDGMPFNAQAVAANLDRITDPATSSQKSIVLLGPYEGYTIVDDHTIQIRLAEPYSALLDGFAQIYLGMASPAALSDYSLNRYQFHQAGTGPFEFVDYVPGDHVTLRRNPNYNWGPPFYQLPGEGAVDEIVYRFFTDAPTRSLALENEDVHIIGELLPTDARALAGNSEVQLAPVNIPGQPLQFLINTQRFPTDKIAVRQALLFGTNRTAIVDTVFQGFSPVAWGPLSSSTLYYHPGMQGLYAHDTGQAESLLASAGFADANDDGYLDLGGATLEVKVIVPPWGLIPDVAQLLQDQWRSLGIRAVLEPVPGFNALLEAVNTGEYHLVAFNTFGMDPSLLNDYFMSDGNTNFSAFSSTELDNILSEAARRPDPNVRRALYAQAQEVIMQEALVLPVREYVNLNGRRSNVQGLRFDPYGWFPLMQNVTLASDS